jgi:uncharacterized protein YcsI (UPF0317 family)
MNTAADVRLACRSGQLASPTPGLAPGFVQANLVILPADWAFDFLLFCQRNPKPCPLLDVTDAGESEPKYAAPGADLRTDLPAYRVWEHGQLVAEPSDVREFWRADLVSFLIGCSFTFEAALVERGLPVRHIEQNRNVPMYRTSIPCKPAGRFRGPLVVSMRPMTPAQAVEATRVCDGFPLAHGTPVHIGDPNAIGISDVNSPDYGEAVEIGHGEVPVFWACGVTPQAALAEAKPPFAITHKPGHMFLTDLKDWQMRG